MPQIPAELIKILEPVGTKRFIKILPKSKKAFETGWAEPENQYEPTDPELVNHIEKGGNVGLVGGRGLLLLDTDEPETEEIARQLPPTTMIKSGGRGERYHRLYISDLDKIIPLKLGSVSEKVYGEIRCNRAYVVAAGSIHEETGNLYKIHDARPLTFISEQTLREAFKDFLPPKEEPKTEPPRRIEPTPFDNLRVVDVCAAYGYTVSGDGNELRGKRPGGNNPSSMTVNPSENLWFSHPDQTGGGVAELIAVYEGILTLSEVEKGCLANSKFYEVIKAAREKGLIPDPNETFRQVANSINEPTTKGSYFILGKDKKKHLQYDVVIVEILSKNTFKTFTDTNQTYVYSEKGIYFEDPTNSVIKQELINMLGIEFKKSYAEETIYQIKILTYANREESEPNEEYLNLKNGILNLDTLELIPHSPEYFFTTRSETEYNPAAKAEKFLKLVKGLGLSETKLKTLQEFSGYVLLNSPKYKKAIFVYGPTDSSKTTVSKAIINVVGPENTCSIPIQNLDKRFQEQRLYKKPLNIVGDLGSEAFKAVSMFKRTTGGDIIEAEIKGANKTIKFVWNGKHWFDANDLPDPQGDADTDAFYNRLIMIPFSRQLTKEEINKNLPNELAEDTEKSGILNWMIEGLQRLENQQDFTDKTEITEIREHYKRASNTVYCFAQDQCTIVPGSYIHTGEAFRLYAEYCVNQGFSSIGKSKFYDQLQANLTALTRTKETIEPLGRVHVFLNLEIEGADLSKVSKMSTHSILPPSAIPLPQTTLDNEKNDLVFFEGDAGGVRAEGGNVENMDKMDKMDKTYPDAEKYNQDKPLIDLARKYLKNNGGFCEITALVAFLRDSQYEYEDFKRLKPYTLVFRFDRSKIHLLEVQQ